MNTSRFWVTVAVMAATVMQVLDTTIINVALPHMSGELSATPDSISWVLTSYLMGSAVFMPLTGFMTDRFGRKRYLLFSIAGFVVTSGLCGIAHGLPEMVVFRLLQGVFGASLVPLSQAIMVETFPVEARGRAMAIWGMGVMVAPIMGPTLGGYLTEVISWRWTFYINLPVGIASFLLAARFVPDTTIKQRDMDWIGFATLATAIACIQLVLDRGADKDWFDSTMICAATAAAVVAFAIFLWKSLAGKGHPLFDLGVLKDRNLAVACVIMLSTGLGVYGGQLLLPLFLENQLGFPTREAGLYLMPRGIATLISMSLVGKYGHHFSPRSMVFVGMLLSFAGALSMTHLTPQVAGSFILPPLLLQGFGMGLIFIPLASLAFATVPRNLAPEAAGLYSLMRAIGSSIGVSIAATYLNYSAKVHWADLRATVTPFNQSIRSFLQPLGPNALYFFDPSGLRLSSLGAEMMAKLISQQAMVKAFASTFSLITVSFIAMLPLLLLIKAIKPAPADPAHAAME
ncbi:MAG: DHA2 family efflux MFS transporter permease subunit [Burkholderiales bacterium]|nr:DHA2 family efflux MFS transporter permease subunit [Burkholderiales bacterium]